MVGLGGCPVAVTVYPPGRGCLHSARAREKSRLRAVLLRAATTSASAQILVTKMPSSPDEKQTSDTPFR